MKVRTILAGFMRCYDRIIGAGAATAAALAIVLMLIVTFDVIMSYFFQSPTSWAGEISAYILVWTPFLAGAWILKHDKHVRMDILYDRLNERNKAILSIFMYIVMAIVCVIVVWFGVLSVIHHYNIKFLTPTLLMLPKWPLLAIIPIGFLLLFIECCRGAFKRIQTLGADQR